MSAHDATLPDCAETVITPRRKDLGGFSVGRVLPVARHRMVGPFIFFDEMGPARFEPGTGIDVRPHPHIGLATVTYLFDGEMRHQDSLGYDQIIRPGDVNWMTAGRGITHSERTDDTRRQAGQTMHGIQTWVALPKEMEETEASFHHHPADSLPILRYPGVVMRLIVGTAFGETAPPTVFSPIFYLSLDADAGATVPLTADYPERAIYVVDGTLDVDGQPFDRGSMIVFKENAVPTLTAKTALRAMALGGASLGKRFIWWNLVASKQEMIDAARADWAAGAASGFTQGRFRLPPGDNEYIPPPAD